MWKCSRTWRFRHLWLDETWITDMYLRNFLIYMVGSDDVHEYRYNFDIYIYLYIYKSIYIYVYIILWPITFVHCQHSSYAGPCLERCTFFVCTLKVSDCSFESRKRPSSNAVVFLLICSGQIGVMFNMDPQSHPIETEKSSEPSFHHFGVRIVFKLKLLIHRCSVCVFFSFGIWPAFLSNDAMGPISWCLFWHQMQDPVHPMGWIPETQFGKKRVWWPGPGDWIGLSSV